MMIASLPHSIMKDKLMLINDYGYKDSMHNHKWNKNLTSKNSDDLNYIKIQHIFKLSWEILRGRLM